MPQAYDDLRHRYARMAPKYDHAWSRYSRLTLRRAAALVAELPRPPRHVLDIACGTGVFAGHLLPRFPDLRFTGVDVSSDMLAVARRRWASDDRTTWVESVAEHLPLDDRRFDVATCTNAFHLINDQATALAECRRVLQPDGVFIVLDWCRDFMSIRLLRHSLAAFGRFPRHILALDEMTSLIGAAGFSVSRAERFRIGGMWGMQGVVARSPAPAGRRRSSRTRPTFAKTAGQATAPGLRRRTRTRKS